MAGDWIKWVKGLESKPEVFRMASILKLDRFSVASRLMLVWSWADENIHDKTVDEHGHASVTLGALQGSLIDAVSGVAGFADSMTAVGWLLQRNGSLVFPNFNRHNGETAKQRALAANRQRKSRLSSVTETSRNERDKTVTRPEKPSKEVTPNGVTETPTPLPFTSSSFGEAWSKWVQHRKEINAKLKPTTIEQQFKRFISWGEERSIAAIYHTIEKGWTGIREPDVGETRSSPQRRETPDERRHREIAEARSLEAQRTKETPDVR